MSSPHLLRRVRASIASSQSCRPLKSVSSRRWTQNDRDCRIYRPSVDPPAFRHRGGSGNGRAGRIDRLGILCVAKRSRPKRTPYFSARAQGDRVDPRNFGGLSVQLHSCGCAYAAFASSLEFSLVRLATGYSPPHPAAAVCALATLVLVMLALTLALATRL